MNCFNFEELRSKLDENVEEKLRFSFQTLSLSQVKTLANVLSTNTALTWLYLDSVGINEKGGILLAKVLQKNTTLEYLNLYSNKLDAKGLTALCGALKENRTLEHLYAGNNVISDPIEKSGLEAALALAQVLEVNSSLLTVGFSENSIGDEGCSMIMRSLCEKNQTLQTLAINADGITNAYPIGKLFSSNKTLTKFSASNNHFRDVGCISIAENLAENSSLTYLDLYGSIQAGSKSVIKAFVDAFSVNQSLTFFGIEQNIAPLELKQAILTCTKRNLETQRQAYYNALNENDSFAWKRSKCIVVGEGGAGKSSTVNSLLRKPFNPSSSSTIGINVIEVKSHRHRRWREHVPKHVTRELATNIAIDRLQKGSELKVSSSKENETKKSGDVQAAGPESIEMNPAREIKRENAFQANAFNEIMAEGESLMLSIWDYGGQSVFQPLHQLFFTNNAVYLVVHNLKDYKPANRSPTNDKHDKAIASLGAWLGAIRTFAPNAEVIVVGTCATEVKPKNMSKIVKRIHATCTQIYHKPLRFHAVDNKTNAGIKELQDIIESTIDSLTNIHMPVPVRWTLCLDELLSHGESWLLIEDVRSIANTYGAVSELQHMLIFFTQTGIVLYFTATEALRNVVILKPEWLLEKISKVIFDPSIHAPDTTLIKANAMEEDMNTFLSTGVICIDMIELLWGKQDSQFLIDLMKSLMLASSWRIDDNSKYFFIPVMAPDIPIEIPGRAYFVDFEEGYLPSGIFERLVCFLLEYTFSASYVDSKPIVGRSFAKITVGSREFRTVVFLAKKDNCINLCVEDEVHENEILKATLSLLNNIKSDLPNNTIHFIIKDENGEVIRPADIYREGEVKVSSSHNSISTEWESSLNYDAFLDR